MYQSTAHIMMVRPAGFGYNPQTARTNRFQQKPDQHASMIAQSAIAEFDSAVALLRENGVSITVIQDTAAVPLPDAVFPNNWISFSNTGEVFLYPMALESRQQEVRPDIVETLRSSYQITRVTDLREGAAGRYLEGTGSMVFDHIHRTGYASISERTDPSLFESFCNRIGYLPVSFRSYDKYGSPIYHTNVMMCISEHFAVLCSAAIASSTERENTIRELVDSGHQLIEISIDQMHHYAGNMISLKNDRGEDLTIMSAGAKESLTPQQLKQITAYAKIVPLKIPTIERIGGGSARCMIAEIFCNTI